MSHILTAPCKTGFSSFRKNIRYHFYASHTPCGDASIIPVTTCPDIVAEEKLLAANSTSRKRKVACFGDDSVKKIPKLSMAWNNTIVDVQRTGGKPVPGELLDPKLSGLAFHIPGLLRSKPGRGESTNSMSCSDKIAKWNAVGCLGALISHFLPNPLYFTSIVTGKCPYSRSCMERAVFDRIAAVSLDMPYKVHKPLLLQSELEFMYSVKDGLLPCGSAMSWSNIPSSRHEAIANGYKLGSTCKQIRLGAGQCSISKNCLFSEFMEIKCALQSKGYSISTSDSPATYRDYKDSASGYQKAWSNLRKCVFMNWKCHDRDMDQFFVGER